MSVATSPGGGGGGPVYQGSLHPRREAPPYGGSRPASVKLSLNALRLGESFDTIKLDVGLLAWHIGHFPTENDTVDKVSEDDLYAILELSQNIGTNVDRIFSLRNQQQDQTDAGSVAEEVLSPPQEARNLTQDNPELPGRRKSYDMKHGLRVPAKRSRSPSCRTCSTDHTPKWRNGPAGPGTLCNVCGLIYAKRRGRVRGKPVRQPSSC